MSLSTLVTGGNVPTKTAQVWWHVLRTSQIDQKISQFRRDLSLPATTVPLTPSQVLWAMAMSASSTAGLLWDACAETLFVVADDDQLAMLGLDQWVHHPDREMLRPLRGERPHHTGNNNPGAPDPFQQARNRVYQRFYRSLRWMLEPLDGSAFAGARRKRLTRAEVHARRAAHGDRGAQKETLLATVCNDLIAKSVFAYPAGYGGSIAIDATNIPSSRATGTYFEQPGLHGPDPDAHYWALDRYHAKAGSYSYAATIVKSVPDPNQQGLFLGLGISWSKPTGGDSDNGIGAIQHAKTSGAISDPDTGTRKTKATRYVIVDDGFAHKLDFKPRSKEEGYEVVHMPRKADVNSITDLGSGVVLFHGTPFCPGTHALIDTYRRHVEQGAPRTKIEEIHEKLVPLRMRRRGLPQPSKDGETHDVVFYCPATRRYVTCPLGPPRPEGAEDDDERRNRPAMPNPPAKPGPPVCEQDSMQFKLTRRDYKAWQPEMTHAPRHTELYSHRNTDEAFHGYMKRDDFAGLREHRHQTVTSPALALWTTLAVIDVNIALQANRGITAPPA